MCQHFRFHLKCVIYLHGTCFLTLDVGNIVSFSSLAYSFDTSLSVAEPVNAGTFLLYDVFSTT